MGRLIDEDVLLKNLEWLEDYDHYVLHDIEITLDETPSVKAIPVEWIEERIKFALSFMHSKAEGKIVYDGCVVTMVSASFTAQVLANLIEAWEGENEKDI